MHTSNTFLRAALGLTVTLFSACVDDDGNMLANDPAAFDGTQSTDGDLADTGDPESSAPLPDPDPFVTALDRVEFSANGSRIELLAYNVHDQLIGMLALEYHEVGTAQLIAEFDDGIALVDIDGDSVTDRHGDLHETVIARRLGAVALEIDSGPQEGWGWCAGMVIGTIATCWNPAMVAWVCGSSALLTTCYCLDHLADQYGWLHDEC